jgi:glycosyltransferase involved in cell wall biosynthesis
MSDDPAVSFVVPAYNEEALLASCLAAIQAEIARTQCRAEVIVVNNGSTDGTRQIAASFPGVVIIDEPQRGLVPARRAGCLAARGKLIANIDADTILTEGWLSTALREFQRTANLAALSGPFIHYDLPPSAQWVAAAFYRVGLVSCMVMRFVVRAGAMMQGGNFIVSRSALDAAGGFNPDFCFYGEDTELAVRMSRVGAVKFSFALPAFSSGRRFAAEGLFRVGLRYATNHLWTILFGQPYSPNWLDFRHATAPNGRTAPAAATPLRAEPPAS